MNGRAQAAIMLLVGGAILRISLTDVYLRYVKAGLRPFLIAAGLLLVVAAVMTLWYELRSAPSDLDGRSDHVGRGGHDSPGGRDGGRGSDGHQVGGGDDGHGHAHEPRIAWLLVLPVFALLLVAPPALGSFAANRAGTSLAATSDFPPLPAGDPVELSTLDYATRAVFDKGRSLGGRTVAITGFVAVGAGRERYLVRMTLSCCAADARPIKIGMTGEVPAEARADSWLQVTGRYTARTEKDPVNGETIPFLEVVEAHQVPAPQQQYIT
jgi:uncharacterized repeat protein (TIGR03943 family)